MAKVKNLDVWIKHNNTVYTAVPFAVVTDWITQGRLVGDDCIRPSGTEDAWYPIAKVRQLAAYLPQPGPARAEDEAEALEPVAFELTYQRPRTEPEDDVDMIPLIDVSLVLLIYFMMLIAAAGPVMAITVPKSEFGQSVRDTNSVALLIDYQDEKPLYGLMAGKKTVVTGKEDANEVVEAAKELFKDVDTKVNFYINAHRDTPSGQIRDAVARFTVLPEINDKIQQIYFGTGDKGKSP